MRDRACNHPYCDRLQAGPWCDEHKPQGPIPGRTKKSSTKAGYGWKWRLLSTDYLTKHPKCVGCGSRARHVHHIIRPRGMRDPLWFDVSNLQALCISCHCKETNRERAE